MRLVEVPASVDRALQRLAAEDAKEGGRPSVRALVRKALAEYLRRRHS